MIEQKYKKISDRGLENELIKEFQKGLTLDQALNKLGV